MTKPHATGVVSGFGLRHSFVIRHSEFVISPSRSAHFRYLRQGQDSRKNVDRLRALQLLDRDRAVHRKSPGFRPPEILEMRSAAERVAYVVRVGANVKAFAAHDREIDLGRSEAV